MKTLQIWIKAVGKSLRKIHLVDKCLLIFMGILMMQSAYTLFANRATGINLDYIDVVIRTSTAGIFGYFLSGNFICSNSSGESGRPVAKGKGLPPKTDEGGAQGLIGFADTPKLQSGTASSNNSENLPVGRLQIIAATGIGLFSLIVLILLRNVSSVGDNIMASSSGTATVAQFRDFVSGCIGFLIGCPSSMDDF